MTHAWASACLAPIERWRLQAEARRQVNELARLFVGLSCPAYAASKTNVETQVEEFLAKVLFQLLECFGVFQGTCWVVVFDPCIC